MKEKEWNEGKRRRSAEEKERLMEEYRASGKTQKQFCEDKGVPLATLTLWLRKSRKEAKAPRLIEVSMPSVGDGMPVEVLLPEAGMAVKIAAGAPVTWVGQLIRALRCGV